MSAKLQNVKTLQYIGDIFQEETLRDSFKGFQEIDWTNKKAAR